LRWSPARPGYMKRPQFPDGPAMIRDASGHGRRRDTSVAETRVRCAKVIDRAEQVHAMLQRQCVACERPATARQRCEAFPERRVEPLNGGRVDDAVALRAASQRLHACRCAIYHATLRCDDATTLVALHDFRDEELAPRTEPW